MRCASLAAAAAVVVVVVNIFPDDDDDDDDLTPKRPPPRSSHEEEEEEDKEIARRHNAVAAIKEEDEEDLLPKRERFAFSRDEHLRVLMYRFSLAFAWGGVSLARGEKIPFSSEVSKNAYIYRERERERECASTFSASPESSLFTTRRRRRRSVRSVLFARSRGTLEREREELYRDESRGRGGGFLEPAFVDATAPDVTVHLDLDDDRRTTSSGRRRRRFRRRRRKKKTTTKRKTM